MKTIPKINFCALLAILTLMGCNSGSEKGEPVFLDPLPGAKNVERSTSNVRYELEAAFPPVEVVESLQEKMRQAGFEPTYKDFSKRQYDSHVRGWTKIHNTRFDPQNANFDPNDFFEQWTTYWKDGDENFAYYTLNYHKKGGVLEVEGRVYDKRTQQVISTFLPVTEQMHFVDIDQDSSPVEFPDEYVINQSDLDNLPPDIRAAIESDEATTISIFYTNYYEGIEEEIPLAITVSSTSPTMTMRNGNRWPPYDQLPGEDRLQQLSEEKEDVFNVLDQRN